MEEHRLSILYIFEETDAFNTKHGEISESARSNLYFYLMLGRGKPIENTGGLKEIRCESPDGKESWDVVFIAYNCPAIRIRLYFLLVKFPTNVIKNLSREQKDKLRILKEMVDEYVRRRYGT